MTLQPVNTHNPELLNSTFSKPDTSLRERPFGKNNGAGGRTGSTFAATYYSSESMVVNYSNKDGDTVSLSMEHIEYQKAMISFNGEIGS